MVLVLGVARAQALDMQASFTIPQLPAVVDLNGPIAPGTGFAATFTDGGGPVALADPSAATITDLVQDTVAGMSVRISNLLDGSAERLDATITGTVISKSYDPSTGQLVLTGVDTIAHYQGALRSLVYNNGSLNPNTANRIIIVIVNDGTVDSMPATCTVTLIPMPSAFDVMLYAVSDMPTSGLLPASGPGGRTLTWQLRAPPSHGTATLLNAGTGLVGYTPDAGFSGRDTFTFAVSDGVTTSTAALATVLVSPRLAAVRPQVLTSPPREGFLRTPLAYALVADATLLPPGADLLFLIVGAPAGAAVVKTGARTATVTWTATGTPEVHQEIGILIIDPASGSATYQAIQVLWHASVGGNG